MRDVGEVFALRLWSPRGEAKSPNVLIFWEIARLAKQPMPMFRIWAFYVEVIWEVQSTIATGLAFQIPKRRNCQHRAKVPLPKFYGTLLDYFLVCADVKSRQAPIYKLR